MDRHSILAKVKRIIVKVGTSSLTTDFKLDEQKIKRVVSQLSDLKNKNYEVILVTSGAICAGSDLLDLSSKPASLPLKQACASVGQLVLMNYYSKLFEKYSIKIGQVLLTRNDFKNRQSYLNSRNTLLSLLSYGVIPIVNENDTVATEEIVFGDNDTLSALIFLLADADLLIILTDVDGFCFNGKVLNAVTGVTKQMEDCATDTKSSCGIGGMLTKLRAIKQIIRNGGSVVIANSNTEQIINRIMKSEEAGTFFFPTNEQMSSKKQWIAYGAASAGKIIIDGGAKEAITSKKKSLLASGILKVEDKFKIGDSVEIYDNHNNLIGRGIVNYKSKDIEKICGRKSSEILGILGFKTYDEIIDRNNMVIF